MPQHTSKLFALRPSARFRTLLVPAISLFFAQVTLAESRGKSTATLEEIVITSQKRQQNIQDVPVSVISIAGEKMDSSGLDNVEELTTLIPNIHFTQTGISTQVRVRGIGSGNSQGFEQSVGMYVDGIYYGRAQLFRSPLFDLERAEILRGPQTTLFGKNSTAGALNIQTADPSHEFSAKINGSFGLERSENEYNMVLNGPISDSLSGRIAIRKYEDEGYLSNTLKNTDEPKIDEESYRVGLKWNPANDFTLTFKYENNDWATTGRPMEIIRDEVGPRSTTNIRYSEFLSLSSLPTFDTEQNFEKQMDAPESSDNNLKKSTLTASWFLDKFDLTSVTGYLEYTYDEQCDCDYVPIEVIHLNLGEDVEQWSQEFRISSNNPEKPSWLAGVFFQKYDQSFYDKVIFTEQNLLASLASPVFANTVADRRFAQNSDAWSIYGNYTLPVGDQIRINLGARYSSETKKASKQYFAYEIGGSPQDDNPLLGWIYYAALGVETQQLTTGFNLPNPLSTEAIPLANVAAVPLAYGGHNVSGEREESEFMPSVSIEYDVDATTMLYFSYTRGYKSGGFDPRANTAGTLASPDYGQLPEFDSIAPLPIEDNANNRFEFDEERVTSYEIGLKASLADGKGELNIALYRMDFDDLQVSQFDGTVGFNVGNAAKTRVQGVDAESRWVITDALNINVAFSYLDFEYINFQNGNCSEYTANDSSVGTVDLDGDGDFELCDYSGLSGQFAPEITANISLDHTYHLFNDANLNSIIDVQYVGEHQTHTNLDPNGEIDGYTMLNARLNLSNGSWSVALVGRNLLDENAPTFLADAPLSASQVGSSTFYGFIRPPRQASLELAYSF